MNYIFKNKGEIDSRSITTFGVSSKEDANPIGFFGTGLKYAIAILLREGCSITIHSGTKKLEFATRNQKIRVDSFEFVTMNKRALGFTTELGKTWEVWQAVRELYCNCIDESGDVFTTTNPEIEVASGYTTIAVSGDKVQQVMDNLHQYILQSTPIAILDNAEIHPGTSEFFYYKGVQVYKLPKPSLFTYNLIAANVPLTEDRTLKDFWNSKYTLIRSLLSSAHCSNEILCARKEFFEHDLDFADYYNYSPEFLASVQSLVKANAVDLNHSAVKALYQARPEAEEAPPELQLSVVDQRRFEKAVSFLRKLNINISEYPVVFTEYLGEGVLGRAKNETILISRLALHQGTKILAGTLMEEYFHLKYKLQDLTYGMQNFLVDRIMTIGEELTGEPL